MVKITMTGCGAVEGCFWMFGLSVILVAVHASPAAGRGPGPGYQRRLLQDTAIDTLEAESHKDEALIRLEEELWGPVTGERSDREKRLFKPKALGLGASIGKQVGKQVASKAFNSVKQGVVKKVLSVSASSSGSSSSNGLKVAKTVGTKAAKAATVIGIKTLLLNLVFGKINQLIAWKTRLLDNLEKQNRAKNQQFLKPVLATTPSAGASSSGSSSGGRGNGGGGGGGGASTNGTANGDPDFDAERISLNVPDELFAPAFNSINSVSTIIGNVIQNTAERLARFIEALKPMLRYSLGFQGPKRETIPEPSEEDEGQDVPSAYADTSGPGDTSPDVNSPGMKSPIKSSYAALVHKR